MSTQILSQLIDAKRGLLAQLRELAARQLALVAEGGSGALVSLLAAKQNLLDQLVAVEAQLDPYRREDPETRVWNAPADRARCAQTADECSQLLDDLMQMERQAIEHMHAQQSVNRQSIHTAHESASARAAYLSASPQAAGRFDLTSES